MSNRNSYDSNRSVSLNPQVPPPVMPHSGYHISPAQQQQKPQKRQSAKGQAASYNMSTDADASKFYTAENPPSRCIEYVAIFLAWVLTVVFFPFVVCTCYKGKKITHNII